MKNPIVKLLCISIYCVYLLTLSSCDALTAKKENEKENEIELSKKIEHRKKIEDRNRQWLNDNESKAKKLAEDFTRQQGYSIQSIKTDLRRVGQTGYRIISSDKPISPEIHTAYYDFNIVTGDTSNRGLIYIIIRVKYEYPNWTIDYFRPYVI